MLIFSKIQRLVMTVFALAITVPVVAADLPALGCTLEPSRTVAVSSPVPGVIERFDLDRGDRVKRGALLFKLRDGVEQATVALAEVKAEFAERKLARNTELLEDDLLSDHERDEIETERQVAYAELRAAREQLQLRTVVSPISGVITDKLAHAGEYVAVDPVLELAQLDPLYVELLMPASWFGRLSTRQPVVVVPGEPLGGRYDADIAVIDPVIDAGSGTFRVRLKMANSGNRLPAGVNCTATVADE